MTITSISTTPTPTTGNVNGLEGKGATKTTGKLGEIGGHRVQQALTAQAPAARSGIGTAIAKFFTATLPSFFMAAKEAILGLFRTRDAAPTVQPTMAEDEAPKPPKPLSEYRFPGDFVDRSGTYAEISKSEQQACVYATVKHHTDNVDDQSVNAFLRSNDLPTQKLARAEGLPLMADVRRLAIQSFSNQGPLAFREASYDDKVSSYEAISGKPDNGIDSAAAARKAVATAEAVYAQIFGTPGDQTSIEAAAGRVPQGLCDALAIGIKGIDDSSVSEDLKQQAKSKLLADMIALRVINPGIVTPLQDEGPIDNATKVNILEFSKFAQNVANKVSLSSTGKEKVHPAAMEEMASRGTEAKLRATYDSFCAAVLARASPEVVTAAVTSGKLMITAFEEAQA